MWICVVWYFISRRPLISFLIICSRFFFLHSSSLVSCVHYSPLSSICHLFLLLLLLLIFYFLYAGNAWCPMPDASMHFLFLSIHFPVSFLSFFFGSFDSHIYMLNVELSMFVIPFILFAFVPKGQCIQMQNETRKHLNGSHFVIE